MLLYFLKVKGCLSLLGLLLLKSTACHRSSLGLCIHTGHSRHNWEDMNEEGDQGVVALLGNF